ncbi:Regulator of RpoS [uncultured archaeon]|nr:Regulator of RpoS [uncultured archaeon]
MAKKVLVLVIEDEPDVAETMKMLLEREGYQVEYTLDPRKGLELADKVDVVLLDIMMPVMSGREVLAQMKKRKIKTPVIVVSAVGMPLEVERELQSKYPGVGFLSKTFMHTDLAKEVRKKIGK